MPQRPNRVRRILSTVACALLVGLAGCQRDAVPASRAIQVAAAQRKNETSIMRLVGASRWMTELPFMLEAVIASTIGGVVAIALIAAGKYYVLDSVFAGPTKRGVIPNLSANDVVIAGGAGLIIGIVLSAVTAVITLRFRVKL